MKCEIVAELSCNHGGKLENAIKLIEECASVGADAIKFQCWSSSNMVLDKSIVIDGGKWDGKNLFDLYEEVHTPWAWFPEMIAVANERKIKWFSSVCDVESLGFLESLGCPRYKISSFELTDLDLIGEVTKCKKPIILSTGMASVEEIMDAVAISFHRPITLLKCVSAYPSSESEANLIMIREMKHAFKASVGLSDHSLGIDVALAAIYAGASMIEKHVKLPDYMGIYSHDQEFSITPLELKKLLVNRDYATSLLGEICYGPVPSEKPHVLLRRSLHFSRDLPAGSVITNENVRSARSAKGMQDMYDILDKRTARDVFSGNPVLREDIDD